MPYGNNFIRRDDSLAGSMSVVWSKNHQVISVKALRIECWRRHLLSTSNSARSVPGFRRSSQAYKGPHLSMQIRELCATRPLIQFHISAQYLLYRVTGGFQRDNWLHSGNGKWSVVKVS